MSAIREAGESVDGSPFFSTGPNGKTRRVRPAKMALVHISTALDMNTVTS
jgi:hypothetical protein